MSTNLASPRPSLSILNHSKSKTKTICNFPFPFRSNPSQIPFVNPNPQIKLTLSKSLTLTPSCSAASAYPEPHQTLKSRLHNGHTLYGLFLCSFSPTLAEIAGLAGYDFVVVDMEHGYGGIPEALTCLRALSATHTPAILRLPETSESWAKKALDLGPQGIMFPMIHSPKQAKKAVSYCRYPPKGVRGAALSIIRASGYGTDAGYLGDCEDELLIMCQVESEEAAEKVEEIAAVEGVDCIQMGPLDMSASMGYLWDPGNKKVRETMRKVEKDVLGKSRAYLAGFAMPHDSPEQLKSRGYHMVSGAVDVALFRSAAVEDVNKFKMSLEMDLLHDSDLDADDQTADEKIADEKYWSE